MGKIIKYCCKLPLIWPWPLHVAIGAALHVHDFAIVDPEWLVRNVTYRPHCYICFTDDQSVRFYFSSGLPKPLSACSPWALLEELRAKTVNVTELDDRYRLTSRSDHLSVIFCVRGRHVKHKASS